MCLVVLAFDVDPEHALIVAANRDEYHERPTLDAGWWPDAPDILGGRDLQAGGSWLALHRGGRIGLVTNYRDAARAAPGLRSRGHLVTEFLECDVPPFEYLRQIDAAAYAGFNLLVSDGSSLGYLSNRGADARELPAGIYGLSNATLDTPWEKVKRSKTRLAELIDANASNDTELLRLLDDRQKGPASEVESDRLPFAAAHAITAPFIVLPDYGTRCSTVVRADRSGRWTFLERRFDAAGRPTGESRFSIRAAVDRE
ncbi:MAG: NRDE family protein [Gammaproteobacteria bacterium]|nr:NRDE family protein [Gammaproteobacteria bacterium]